MFAVWNQIIVKNEEHERAGQAGFVFAVNHTTHPDDVVVQFDVDGTRESVKVADIRGL